MIMTVINALIQVESGGDWKARNGDCWGGLQISSVMVEDINRFAGTKYKHEDAFYGPSAIHMALLYLDHYATAENLGHEATVEDMAGIWRNGLAGWKREHGNMEYVERVRNLVEAGR